MFIRCSYIKFNTRNGLKIKASRSDTIVPPFKPPPLISQGDFCIKVETYEGSNQKFTGYGYNSEIIAQTVDYCERHKKNKQNSCSRPTVTTSENINLVDMIFVEEYIHNTTYVHFLKKYGK